METLNANAEVLSRFQSLQVNLEAAKGLQNVLRTNLGPRGTVSSFYMHILHLLPPLIYLHHGVFEFPFYFVIHGSFLISLINSDANEST